MRFLVAFVLIYIAYYVAGIGAAPHPPATTSAPLVANQATYDTRFDNIDLDEVLSQERLLRNYIKCLENTGPCTSDSKMLKGFSYFRDTPRRYINRLRQMLAEAEVWLSEGDALLDRQSAGGLGALGADLRSARQLPLSLLSGEG
ncbi:putative odorant-binding protein A10 isoform X2 [Rhagoletis pomonella]|uniref:putative odorant-binding protein A10 isoform X2 n=1 Tax=Rhagoletis pomonella TaxID=28610 RepID=UPI00177C578E|nr:putative odorant-binding protein A10 isoform X2 [Rhagoletis pomonella]